MKLSNLRFGFATNSSSSHSVVFLPPGTARDDYDGDAFGWSFFTLATREAKMEYLAQQIRGAFSGPDWVKQAVAAEITGTKPSADGYVDHQSAWDLPRDWNGEGLDRDFLIALRDFLSREGVAILGGNDNDDSGHPLRQGRRSDALSLPTDSRMPLVCRRDGDWWVLFNRESGDKVVVSFGRAAAPRVRADAPELVDIKLTDFCPFGCPECYQGSTTAGAHADADLLRLIAMECENARVFEVALGGGEPTLHPAFVSILESFRRAGVVPNFTTRNLSWLRNDEERPRILAAAGAFAVSVSEVSDVDRLAAALDYHSIPHSRTVLHLTMGTMDEWQFSRVMEAARRRELSVTLLGFKRTGRGQSYQPKKYDGWLERVKELASKGQCPRFGIDTVLAAESVEALKASGIPEWLYYVKEGQFSMYIDAVARKCAASSFTDVTHDLPGHVSPYRKDAYGVDLAKAWDDIAPMVVA